MLKYNSSITYSSPLETPLCAQVRAPYVCYAPGSPRVELNSPLCLCNRLQIPAQNGENTTIARVPVLYLGTIPIEMGSGSSVPVNELARLSDDAVYGPKIRDIFAMLDVDGSGAVDLEELRACMYRMVEREFQVPGRRKGEMESKTVREATIQFQELDRSGDGKISLQEFCDAIDLAIENQRKTKLKPAEMSNHRKLREELNEAHRKLTVVTRNRNTKQATEDALDYLRKVRDYEEQQAEQKRAACLQVRRHSTVVSVFLPPVRLIVLVVFVTNYSASFW